MSSKYDALDRMIIERLALDGPLKFAALHTDAISMECDHLEIIGGVLSFRILDQRLQSLRSAGRILYSRCGWVLKKPVGQPV